MELKLAEHWEYRGGVNSCLYSIVPLSYATRHFGRRLGRTNKFVLLSACSKIGRCDAFGRTER